jgi:hypothetical protein
VRQGQTRLRSTIDASLGSRASLPVAPHWSHLNGSILRPKSSHPVDYAAARMMLRLVESTGDLRPLGLNQRGETRTNHLELKTTPSLPRSFVVFYLTWWSSGKKTTCVIQHEEGHMWFDDVLQGTHRTV